MCTVVNGFATALEKRNRVSMNFCRTVLFFTALIPSLLCAQIPVIPLKFENAKNSDHFRSLHLAERFRSMAAAVISKKKNSRTVRLELLPANVPQRFLFLPKKQKQDLTIGVPLQFAAWKSDYAVHTWLASVLILAQMGETPTAESIEKIRTHWIVRGLARKAAGETLFADTPFSRTMPGAYTLISGGYYPSVRQIVHASGTGFSAAAELDAEFAELLLDAAADAGLFRNGYGDALLQVALMKPEENQYTPLETILKKDPKTADCDLWFRNFAERKLINFLTPYSAEYFETKYREITAFRFQDSNGLEQICRPGNLLDCWQKLSGANGRLDSWITELNVLSFRAPQTFRSELAEIRLALSRFRTEQTKEVQEQIRLAEQALFRKVSAYVAMEHLLREAEQKIESPAVRFRRTLETVRDFRIHSRLLLPEIQKNLDRWDDYR